MKVTLNAGRLFDLIDDASQCSSSTRSPVFGYIKLTADGADLLYAISFDGEQGVHLSTTASSRPEEAGSVCIPSDTARALLSKMDRDVDVTVTSVEDKGVLIRSGSIRSLLPILPEKDFIEFPRGLVEYATLSLDASEFRTALEKSVWSANSVANVTKSVMIKAESDHTVVCATNMAGSVVCHLDNAREFDGVDLSDTRIVLSTASVARLLRQTFNTEENMSVLIVSDAAGSVRSVRFLLENGWFMCGVLSAEAYPDISRIFSIKKAKICKIRKDALCKALRRVSVVSAHNYHRSMWQMKDGALSVSASSQDMGDIEESVECQTVGINSFWINSKLALMGIERVEEDELVISKGEGLLPIFFHGYADSKSYRYGLAQVKGDT